MIDIFIPTKASIKMRTICFPILVTTLLSLQGCRSDRSEPTPKNALLPDRLVVFSESVFGQAGDAKPETITSLEAFNDSVIHKALDGKLVLHEAILSHKGLPGSAVMPVKSLYEALDIDKENASADVDKAVSTCVKEITSGLFIEEWNMDADRFLFWKKVIAYQPVRHVPRYYEDPSTHMTQPSGDTSRILLFSVLTDPPEEPALVKSSGKGLKLLAENIRCRIDLFNRPYYEYLYTEENEVSETAVEQWASYNFNFYKYFDREKLINIILDKVTSGSVKAWDPGDQTKVLSLHEVYANLRADSIFLPDDDRTGSKSAPKLKEIYIPRENINSLIFIEDWYYNASSMGIIKIVRGVIPILYNPVYDAESTCTGTEKIPVFLVWFNRD